MDLEILYAAAGEDGSAIHTPVGEWGKACTLVVRGKEGLSLRGGGHVEGNRRLCAGCCEKKGILGVWVFSYSK